MSDHQRDRGVYRNVLPGLLLILILPVTPASVTITSPAESSTAASAVPTLPDSTGQSTEDSAAQRTTLAYSDQSHNGTSDDSTDPPATTKGPEYSTIFTSPDGTRSRRADATINTRIRDERERKEHDQIFRYDYYYLRKWGLICALILCIIGILVLMSGRCRGMSCRRRQKQRYNVTGI